MRGATREGLPRFLDAIAPSQPGLDAGRRLDGMLPHDAEACRDGHWPARHRHRPRDDGMPMDYRRAAAWRYGFVGRASTAVGAASIDGASSISTARSLGSIYHAQGSDVRQADIESITHRRASLILYSRHARPRSPASSS